MGVDIKVCWHYGHEEDFKAVNHRIDSDFLQIELQNGGVKWIPLRHVRWFGVK